MPDFSAVTRADVLNAIAEYDRLGADDFLSTYGFDPARNYLVWHDGRTYDSKALLGVAYRYAAGSPAPSSAFEGGPDGAAQHLVRLGFEVSGADELGGTGADAVSSRGAADVGSDVARSEWAEAAREVLLGVARRYHSVTTYKELATEVQARTRIRTNQLMQHWIGDVLGRVAAECTRRGEPNLSSLCVNSEGSVGQGYAAAVESAGGAVTGDRDDHAAAERLACYRYFEATGLPAGGGVPALAPRLEATRARARRSKPIEHVTATCPRCFTQLSVNGTCGFCG